MVIAKYKNKWLQRLVAVMALFLLASCGSDLGCVEADDWGYPKVEIPSHYDSEDVRGDGLSSMQIVEPIDSGQVLIDAGQTPIVMTIGDDTQWTSWFGGSSTPEALKDVTEEIPWDPLEMVPSRECQYFVRSGHVTYNNTPGYDVAVHDAQQRDVGDLSPKVSKARRYQGETHGVGQEFTCPAPGVIVKNPDIYADCRVPCYMRHGMGLYVGFSHNDTPDGVVIARHIPDAKYPEVPYNIRKTDQENRGMPRVDEDGRLIVEDNGSISYGQGRDGYLLRGFPSTEVPGVMTRDRLFFKIVDTLYTDNYGSYKVNLKEGTRSPKEGPIESVVNIFVTPIMEVMERLWKGLTTNNDFVTLVRATIELFIAFYAMSYMMGMISAPKKDFIVNLVRLAIVVQLLTPDSFEFFYHNFFAAFLEGIAEIIGYIVTPFTDYDPQSPWYSLDQLLRKLWSQETHAKLWATLFSNAVGILYIIGFYIGLILFLLAVVKVVLRYIAAMVILAILVVMGPIFITLMLFGKTRELFDEWVNQFIAVAIELLILFAAVGMFAYIIVFFMEQTLGFRTCWNTIYKLNILDFTLFEFKFWMPDIRYSSEYFGPIWTDANNDGFRGISEFANRYFDLPYFDVVHDRSKIIRFASEKNFLKISDVLLFIGIIFLMNHFLEYVPTLANALKGASPSASASIAGAGMTMYNSFVTATVGNKLSTDRQKELISAKKGKDGKITYGSTGVGRAYYQRIGRDGGLLGGAMRGMWGVGDTFSGMYEKGIMGSLKSALGMKGGARAEGTKGDNREKAKKAGAGALKTLWNDVKEIGSALTDSDDRGAQQSQSRSSHALELQQSRLDAEKKLEQENKERAAAQTAQKEAQQRAGVEQARIEQVLNIETLAKQQLFDAEQTNLRQREEERKAQNKARLEEAEKARLEKDKRAKEDEAKGGSLKNDLMRNGGAVADIVKGMSAADVQSKLRGRNPATMSQAEIIELLQKKPGGDGEHKSRSEISGMRPPPPKS